MSITGEVNGGRVLLKERAYEALKELILNETFPAGTFLSERQLVARLGMSKTPIRSALERLEAEGFVTVSPQQGILVREFSLQEVVDLFDIRIALETFAVGHIAGKVPSAYRARLEENLEAQAQAAEGGDVNTSTRLDFEFHLILCEALGNREIVRTMLGLGDRLYRVIHRISSRIPGRLQASYQDHRAIAQAVLSGDQEWAVRRVREHLEYGKRYLVQR